MNQDDASSSSSEEQVPDFPETDVGPVSPAFEFRSVSSPVVNTPQSGPLTGPEDNDSQVEVESQDYGNLYQSSQASFRGQESIHRLMQPGTLRIFHDHHISESGGRFEHYPALRASSSSSNSEDEECSDDDDINSGVSDFNGFSAGPPYFDICKNAEYASTVEIGR